ncbi:hypothetical protein ACW14Y_05195 [Kitasatospora sp. cg17-2]
MTETDDSDASSSIQKQGGHKPKRVPSLTRIITAAGSTIQDQVLRDIVSSISPHLMAQLARAIPALRPALRSAGVEEAPEFTPTSAARTRSAADAGPSAKPRQKTFDVFAGTAPHEPNTPVLVVVTKYTSGSPLSRTEEYWVSVSVDESSQYLPLTGSFWTIHSETATVSERPDWVTKVAVWSALVTYGLSLVTLLHKNDKVIGMATIGCGGRVDGVEQRWHVKVPVRSQKELDGLRKRVASLVTLSVPQPPRQLS